MKRKNTCHNSLFSYSDNMVNGKATEVEFYRTSRFLMNHLHLPFFFIPTENCGNTGETMAKQINLIFFK